ncbi:MAG: cache domain-containing protein, partial [Synergistaceae bacterium]|nr:cache domain-containing protein [Synergistaceae bacterium]
MTKLKIGGRVFLVSFFLMLTGVTVVSTISSLVFIEAMRDEMDHTLLSTTIALDMELNAAFDRMKEKLFSQTLLDIEETGELIERNDIPKLNERMESYLRTSGFNTITITNSEGVVLSRPHAPNYVGDNISGKGYIGPALKGREVQIIEAGTTINLGLFYGMPIINKEGNVVGTIAAGVNLEDTDIIDQLADMYRAEVTFYYGDKRVNTTLEENGRRITGTKAPPAAVDAVFGRGVSYYGRLKMGDENTLRTLYRPFVFNGERVGILAAGVSTQPLDQAIRSAVYRVAISAAVFVLLAMRASYIFARNIAKLSSEKTQQEIFLNLLMKNTPDAILILDNDGKLIDCSDVFLRRPQAGGADRPEGRTFSETLKEFLSAEEIAQLNDVFAEAMRDKKSISLDKIIDFDHAEIPRDYTVRFSPMFDAGVAIGCLVMFHDLTDLQMAQHAEAALQAK